MQKLVNRIIQRIPFFVAVTGWSLAFGILVPTIYDCGHYRSFESHYPKMEFAALVAMLVSIVIGTAVLFWNKPNEPDAIDHVRKSPFQFRIRDILIGMTLVALLAAISPLIKLTDSVVGWLMVPILSGVLVWALTRSADVRSRACGVLSVMFLPFVWVFPYSKPFGRTSGLMEGFFIGPGLIPATIMHGNQSFGLALMFVLIQLAIGIWLSRRGGKLFMTYVLLLLGSSMLTSMFLHVMYRV